MSETPTPFDATALDDEALSAEFTRVRERGTELSAQDTLTADETAELSELAGRITAIQTEQTARTEAASALQAHRDVFGSLPAPVAVTEDHHSGSSAEPPAPATPAPATPAEAPKTVTASAPPAVPSVATLAPQAPQTPPTPSRVSEFTITLGADGAGALGQPMGDVVDMKTVTKAVLHSFQAYGSAHTGGTSAKRAIAQIRRERPDAFHLNQTNDDDRVVKELIKESRLDGGSLLKSFASSVEKSGSLTAAAGWCAPSENLYDVCSQWSMDGILDLPTATARRGGFNYVDNQPTWAQLDAATNFTILTEAQVIADTPKNCAEIPCPTFTDMRLDVAVTCITGSFLQSAGYPEFVETWVDGTLTNHAHKLNENIISRIVTRAGAPIVIPPQGVVTGTGATGLGADSSALVSALSAVDIAQTDMRYRDRMALNTTFETVWPHWVLTQWRADVARKNGWDLANAALADAEIVRLFAVRNAVPRFVYDWQDWYAGGTLNIGNPAVPATALPTTVNFLIYPAGAVVRVNQDVITLTNVYDSTNLTQNLYTRLFAEEGFNLMYPCGQVRQYTTQACPSGATAYQAYTSCTAPVAAA